MDTASKFEDAQFGRLEAVTTEESAAVTGGGHVSFNLLGFRFGFGPTGGECYPPHGGEPVYVEYTK